MVVNLPPDLQTFVAEEVAAGRYPSEQDLLCDAVLRLQQRRHAGLPFTLESLSPPEEDIVLESAEELRAFLREIDAEVDRELTR